MHPDLTAALHWITQQAPACLDELTTWATCSSGSTNLAGLKAMKQGLLKAFKRVSDAQYALPCSASTGQAILCQKRPALSRRIFLCGHMDTAFPKTSAFHVSHVPEHSRLVGPGVTDMKGGLMVMLTALQAFEHTPYANSLGWDVFINADEELGSLTSSNHLTTLAKRAQVALVFEPTLDERGTLARARKGCGHFTLTATGKAAHAGRHFHQGHNAIILLTRALNAMHMLNHPDASYTINVATIRGGEILNQVPAHASAQLEIRSTDQQEAERIVQRLNELCQEYSSPEASLTLQGTFHRPVKAISPATTALFQKLQQAASCLNLSRHWQDTGGCCDGNNLSTLGIAVLDTLGVRGGNIHTEQEYLCIESLCEQASLTLLLLHDLAAGGLEELYS